MNGTGTFFLLFMGLGASLRSKMDNLSRLPNPENIYPGSRIQGAKKQRIPDPQRWVDYSYFLLKSVTQRNLQKLPQKY
jgi:predicted phosphoadenosine phosphosulfate sulfurtransferase